ncbi:putative selenium-dependent hydroxylase accessory protein YqeC [Pseudodesulfovibrio sp. JC047]|uniref:selenium cofactor biosynthesis protein YqeC n=1 Tax=Pseudodesulfovibrio sp. JC047 TaxID=2683199 RepID=UPI0013D4BDC0|nr:selenium cofactor biosynthesis protein YqeC [Pseudodesulfovibrio sp. JC047]NDV18347.1 putative selenium-dependent hydroxylase accessory protein YqeC [Pseudodesulfovibrio sp. JC047]
MKTHPAIDTAVSFIESRHQVITAIGAGGKTTLLHWIAQRRLAAGHRVVLTTTTKIFPPRDRMTILLADGPGFFDTIAETLKHTPCIVVAKDRDRTTGKLLGLAPTTVDALHALRIADTILVEADGAAQKPLKAPADHEPVIPDCSDICVAVMGLDAVNQPLAEQLVHRSERFAAITGAIMGSPITPTHMVKMATAPNGLFKGCPTRCERSVFLNKADIPGGHDLTKEFSSFLDKNGGASALSWFVGSCCRHQFHPIHLQRVTAHA